MSFPPQSNRAKAASLAEPRLAAAAVPLRFSAETRRGDPRPAVEPQAFFTAGDRLSVSSELTSPSGTRKGVLRPILLGMLVLLAGVGAATIIRMVIGML